MSQQTAIRHPKVVAVQPHQAIRLAEAEVVQLHQAIPQEEAAAVKQMKPLKAILRVEAVAASSF